MVKIHVNARRQNSDGSPYSSPLNFCQCIPRLSKGKSPWEPFFDVAKSYFCHEIDGGFRRNIGVPLFSSSIFRVGFSPTKTIHLGYPHDELETPICFKHQSWFIQFLKCNPPNVFSGDIPIFMTLWRRNSHVHRTFFLGQNLDVHHFIVGKTTSNRHFPSFFLMKLAFFPWTSPFSQPFPWPLGRGAAAAAAAAGPVVVSAGGPQYLGRFGLRILQRRAPAARGFLQVGRERLQDDYIFPVWFNL